MLIQGECVLKPGEDCRDMKIKVESGIQCDTQRCDFVREIDEPAILIVGMLVK